MRTATKRADGYHGITRMHSGQWYVQLPTVVGRGRQVKINTGRSRAEDVDDVAHYHDVALLFLLGATPSGTTPNFPGLFSQIDADYWKNETVALAGSGDDYFRDELMRALERIREAATAEGIDLDELEFNRRSEMDAEPERLLVDMLRRATAGRKASEDSRRKLEKAFHWFEMMNGNSLNDACAEFGFTKEREAVRASCKQAIESLLAYSTSVCSYVKHTLEENPKLSKENPELV